MVSTLTFTTSLRISREYIEKASNVKITISEIIGINDCKVILYVGIITNRLLLILYIYIFINGYYYLASIIESVTSLYDPLCRSVGCLLACLVCHNFLKGREVFFNDSWVSEGIGCRIYSEKSKTVSA